MTYPGFIIDGLQPPAAWTSCVFLLIFYLSVCIFFWFFVLLILILISILICCKQQSSSFHRLWHSSSFSERIQDIVELNLTWLFGLFPQKKSAKSVRAYSYWSWGMAAEQGQTCRCWLKNKQNKPQLELSLISFDGLFLFLFRTKLWRTAVWIWQQRKVRRAQLDPLCNDVTAAFVSHDSNDGNDALLLPLSVLAAEKKQLLFGRPRVLQPNQTYCVLQQEGYIMGYSHTALMPLWSSFTIEQPVSVYLKSCMYQVSQLDQPGLNISRHRGAFRCCFCQTVQVQWKTDLWEFTFARAWQLPTEISEFFTSLPLITHPLVSLPVALPCWRPGLVLLPFWLFIMVILSMYY